LTGGRIRALLLDLDGTLLVNDMEVFGREYFRVILSKFRRVCPGDVFLESLQIATRAMALNDGTDGTNAEVFWAEFLPRVGREQAELMPLFDEFYAREFEALRRYTGRDPDARTLVDLVIDRGYQVAIATQPMFPLVAVLARLRWAGVGADECPYDYIASYESMRACKPHPRYFGELLRHLGREPGECLMVGDSLEADMPARRVGLKTFWVDRSPAGQPPGLACDAWGNLGDLIDLIEAGQLDVL